MRCETLGIVGTVKTRLAGIEVGTAVVGTMTKFLLAGKV